MNSKQRIQATIKGDSTDRRAVSLLLSLYGAKLTECPLKKYYSAPHAYVRGQTAVLETFQPDILFAPFALALEGKAFGSEIRYYEDQAPNLKRPAITDVSEIKKLSLPVAENNLQNDYFIESVRLLAQKHGEQVIIAAICLNPVDLPIMMLGIEGWLDVMLSDSGNAKKMLDFTVPYFVQRANSLLAAGAAFVLMPAAFINPTIVTRDILQGITLNVLQEAFCQVNGPLIIHSGGAVLAPFLDIFADLPNVAGFVLNPGENFIKARKKIGKSQVLIGNINGPNLLNPKEEDIYKQCRQRLEELQNDPHIILGTSAADISFYTPEENIHAIRRAAEFRS